MLRSAKSEDLAQLTELLTLAGLPARGVDAQLSNFLVFESEAVVMGFGGMEFHGADALLRSLVVARAHRGRGIAKEICDRLEARAKQNGARSVYLLTETAESFFAARGYEVVSRSLAPAGIAASEEFAVLCPQSAVLMRRELVRGEGELERTECGEN